MTSLTNPACCVQLALLYRDTLLDDGDAMGSRHDEVTQGR